MSHPVEGRVEPQVLARPEHALSRSEISKNALKVLYRLHRAGFISYLVGGAVRDLLLGRRPKDFDIGTNARPQQVRQLFRNARLIGRRFRLARVAFNDEVVEVATFRRSPEPPEIEEGEPVDVLAPAPEVDEYGTPAEDAWRRDFTVNGLFYDISDFSVVDYVGGLEDLQAGVIRTIGDAEERFVEDPVRMMRAVEYAARLGFMIDEPAQAAIAEMQGEIRRAAPARIGYELGESLRGGHSRDIFRGLNEVGLLSHIVPEAVPAAAGDGLLWRLLECADQANRSGEAIGEEALLGLLFLPAFLLAVGFNGEERVDHPQLERLVRDQLAEPSLRLAFSHYRSHILRHAFMMLPRLSALPRSTKLVVRTSRHEAFPTAWRIATLLGQATGRLGEPLEAWTRALERMRAGQQPVDERVGRPNGGEGARRRRRRRGGRRRGRRAGSMAAQSTAGQDEGTS